MALGNLICEETGKVTGIRVLSSDAAGTKLEVNLQTSGTIRGVGENTLWSYTQLTRPDLDPRRRVGSVAGWTPKRW